MRRSLYPTITCALLLGAGALVGCRPRPRAAFDTSESPQRAQAAQERFRRWGDGRFEVIAFRAGAETTRAYFDDFGSRTGIYRVPFTARIRITRTFTVESTQRVAAHVGEPGWTPQAHFEGNMLAMVFPNRELRAGQELDLSAVAAFDDLEPGWRFRAFVDE